jgi:glucose-6-phosphate dehydrogenase assembly protein OpcA
VSSALAVEVGGWEGRDVRLPEVCHALAELRRPEAGLPPMTLASVLDMIAVAPRPEDVPEMEGIIRGLADHQPSRTVILASVPEASTGIDARVTTARLPAGDDRQVWVEVVTLTLRGASHGGAASAVQPLLRYDLPTFLWWPGEPERRGSELGGLAALAERVITECGRGGGRGASDRLRSLAAWAGSAPAAVTDLAWAAVTPWRQLLAQLLDPESLARLRAHGGTAAIRHAGAEPTAEALFLGGWLVDALGGGLTVELRGGAEGGDAVAEVAISLPAGRTMTIVRAPERASAEVRVTAADGTEQRRVLPLPRRSRAALLAGELEVQRRDTSFERALGRAANLAGGWPGDRRGGR